MQILSSDAVIYFNLMYIIKDGLAMLYKTKLNVIRSGLYEESVLKLSPNNVLSGHEHRIPFSVIFRDFP